MRAFIKAIDSASFWTGNTAHWLSVSLVLIMTYEVIMRYVFTAPTMWAYETVIMIGATLYALAWSYVHYQRAHVRVDVLYIHLSSRKRATIDVVCTLLFFFPVIFALVYMSGIWAWRAWEIGEKSVETYWYPPIAPVRTMVFLGITLFALQGIANFIRDAYTLLRNKPYD